MDLLLNTIMLEPNRWTSDHILSWPLVDLLEGIDEAGFKDLELWGYHVDRMDPDGIARLADALASRSMHAMCVGAYPSFHCDGPQDDAEVARLERVVIASAALGATIFKVFPGRVASVDASAAIWRRTLGRLRGLADRVGLEGMTLALETHGGTLCDSLDSTLRLLSDLENCRNVGICFQPYADDDTSAAIAAFDALGDHVRHLHVQNRDQSRAMTLLEDGDWTDYRRFLPHARATGFDGPLCIEFTAAVIPSAGEAFDPKSVLGNAILDRRFIERLWYST